MFTNFVFSGGGTQCVSYIGILKYFEEIDYLKNLKKIAATSGGSLFALILVLGYSYKDIKNIVLGLEFNTIQDITTENLLDFFKNYGIDTGKKLEYLIKLLLKKKQFNENITFLELFKITKIEITITGTCLNKKCTEYFNYINTPDMKIYLAIRISCAIPIIFNCVEYNDLIYMDGGLLDNYPIDFFKDDIKSTLGFNIHNKNKLSNINSLDKYIFNILISLTNKINCKIKNKYIKNTVIINCDYDSINFNISDIQKKNTIENGYLSIKKFMTRKRIENQIENIIDTIINTIDFN